MVGISFRPFSFDAYFIPAQLGERNLMRRFLLTAAIVTTATALSVGAILAADIEIPKRIAPKETTVHNGPPNCSRWTDDCVNCSRGAAGAPPVCSNIGFACQPKAVRCLQP
jgi:hypothetical protein